MVVHSGKNSKLIGQMLIDRGIITVAQLEEGLHVQKNTKELLCTVFIRLGFASEEKIFTTLATQLNLSYISLKKVEISSDIITKIPAKFASHYKIMPVKLENDILTIATANPWDMQAIDDLKLFLGFDVKPALSSETDILEAVAKYYGIGAATLEKMMTEKKDTSSDFKNETENIETKTQDDASVIKFVNEILSEAIKQRASDIHIEPYQEELRVRFRIDGVLYETNIAETIKYFQPAIVSRIKIMSHLNIAERRLPQDGRIKIKINENDLDLRVSVLPQIFGEAVHIRILSTNVLFELEKIGLPTASLAIIEDAIKKPHGIILVTGPTGAGKSTTLYACLNKINTPDEKIITVEDPVEYQMHGINQIQIQPKIGFDFAMVLRHILRHDPDILMIGEIRDTETAEIAIRAALTGHLIFSTLHTNDAAGAVARLIDMGIEPFLLSSSLECIIAQRLVRVICPDCKEKIPIDNEMFEHFKETHLERSKIQIYQGRGCKNCRFSGYKGRTIISEVLPVTSEIRTMILNRTSSQLIKQKVVSSGMKTLRQDGLQKVLDGLTSLAEVLRVTQEQE